VKRLWSAKQAISRLCVGPVYRQIDPYPGEIRYRRVSELPTFEAHEELLHQLTVNLDNSSSTEVAELPAELPKPTEFWIRNSGPYANVPLHARLEVIYEEEPRHLDIIDEEEPRLIEFNDEEDLYGLECQSHGSGSNPSLHASQEVVDLGFSSSQPPYMSTQSALILSPIPGPKFLPKRANQMRRQHFLVRLPSQIIICQRISSNSLLFSMA
jgi:hypothetical protein